MGSLKDDEIGLIISTDLTHLGIYIVYVLAPTASGWALTASLKKI